MVRTPYDPLLFLLRGYGLNTLGYPELALYDAYKARLLIERCLRGEPPCKDEGPDSQKKAPSESQRADEQGHDDEEDDRKNLVARHHCKWIWANKAVWDELFAGALGQKMIWHEYIELRSKPERMTVQESLEVLERVAWSLLIVSMTQAHCFVEARELSERAARKWKHLGEGSFPWRPRLLAELKRQEATKAEAAYKDFGSDSEEAKTVVRNGTIAARRYPWMGDEYFWRSEKSLQPRAEILASCTNGAAVIRKSEIGEGQIGVFAAVDIPFERHLLSDRSWLAATASTERCQACSKPTNTKYHLDCCEMVVMCCSRSCGLEYVCLVHKAECGRDIIPVPFERPKDLSERSLWHEVMIMRTYLAHLVTNLGRNPSTSTDILTDDTLIGNMVASYNGTSPRPFRFEAVVKEPLLYLESLGIDIFLNRRFESWVLMTIRHRLRNNQAKVYLEPSEVEGDTEVVIEGVWPRHAMFNHSCAPNAMVAPMQDNPGPGVYTTRPIKAGEEICISYLEGGTSTDPREVRSEKLKHWLGTQCTCARCRAEMEGQRDPGVSRQQRMHEKVLITVWRRPEEDADDSPTVSSRPGVESAEPRATDAQEDYSLPEGLTAMQIFDDAHEVDFNPAAAAFSNNATKPGAS